MNLSKRFIRAAALLPLVAASTAMAADNHGSASASISNLRIQLIDLDLNDGISPYLSYRENADRFSDPESYTSVWGYDKGRVTHTPSNYSGSAFGATSTSLVLNSPADLPAGTVAGSAVFAGSSLDTLSLSTSSSIDDITGYGNAVRSSAAFDPLYFYLSPNTSLSITFDMSVQTAMQGGVIDPEGGLSYAEALADVYIHGSHNDPRNAQQFRMLHTSYATGGYPPGGVAGTQTFTALINGAAVEQTIYIEADTRAYVNLASELFVPAPVPEPETWAMLLGGLGLVGAMARRRKAS